VVGFLGCKRTLLAHVELLIYQYPQVLLRAALEPLSAQPVLVFRIAPTHMQDLFGLVELHGVHAGPPLQSVKVPLNGIPSLQRVNHTTQLGVIGRVAEGALSPTVYIANKDIKQHQSQYQPLRHTTRQRSPPGHQAIDYNSLCASIEPVPYPTSGPSVKSMSFQFRDKDIIWESVKGLAQVQADDVSCLPFVHQRCNPITERYQVGQARFALGEAMLAVPSHLLVIHVP